MEFYRILEQKFCSNLKNRNLQFLILSKVKKEAKSHESSILKKVEEPFSILRKTKTNKQTIKCVTKQGFFGGEEAGVESLELSEQAMDRV